MDSGTNGRMDKRKDGRAGWMEGRRIRQTKGKSKGRKVRMDGRTDGLGGTGGWKDRGDGEADVRTNERKDGRTGLDEGTTT